MKKTKIFNFLSIGLLVPSTCLCLSLTSCDEASMNTDMDKLNTLFTNATNNFANPIALSADTELAFISSIANLSDNERRSELIYDLFYPYIYLQGENKETSKLNPSLFDLIKSQILDAEILLTDSSLNINNNVAKASLTGSMQIYVRQNVKIYDQQFTAGDYIIVAYDFHDLVLNVNRQDLETRSTYYFNYDSKTNGFSSALGIVKYRQNNESKRILAITSANIVNNKLDTKYHPYNYKNFQFKK